MPSYYVTLVQTAKKPLAKNWISMCTLKNLMKSYIYIVVSNSIICSKFFFAEFGVV